MSLRLAELGPGEPCVQKAGPRPWGGDCWLGSPHGPPDSDGGLEILQDRGPGVWGLRLHVSGASEAPLGTCPTPCSRHQEGGLRGTGPAGCGGASWPGCGLTRPLHTGAVAAAPPPRLLLPALRGSGPEQAPEAWAAPARNLPVQRSPGGMWARGRRAGCADPRLLQDGAFGLRSSWPGPSAPGELLPDTPAEASRLPEQGQCQSQPQDWRAGRGREGLPKRTLSSGPQNRQRWGEDSPTAAFFPGTPAPVPA